MRGWRDWAVLALYFVVTLALLLGIYSHVIETRFECVVFSSVVPIYFEVVAQSSGWVVELLVQRDHRNEINKGLSERLGAPLEPEVLHAIEELSGQTEKAGARHQAHRAVYSILMLVVLGACSRPLFSDGRDDTHEAKIQRRFLLQDRRGMGKQDSSRSAVTDQISRGMRLLPVVLVVGGFVAQTHWQLWLCVIAVVYVFVLLFGFLDEINENLRFVRHQNRALRDGVREAVKTFTTYKEPERNVSVFEAVESIDRKWEDPS